MCRTRTAVSDTIATTHRRIILRAGHGKNTGLLIEIDPTAIDNERRAIADTLARAGSISSYAITLSLTRIGVGLSVTPANRSVDLRTNEGQVDGSGVDAGATVANPGRILRNTGVEGKTGIEVGNTVVATHRFRN